MTIPPTKGKLKVCIKTVYFKVCNMEVTFLDLRRNTAKLLEALNRREAITLFRRGKPVARIVPMDSDEKVDISKHPGFGMWSDHKETEDVDEFIKKIRSGRFRDL